MQLLKSLQYCHDIFRLGLPYGKVLNNLLLSLSSSDCSSVVELSLSTFFEHHYSSLSHCISHLSSDSSDYTQVQGLFQRLWLDYYPNNGVYSFQTDTTPIEKPFSAKLSQRGYVKIPNNVIADNKSLSIGYNYSYVNLGYTPCTGGSRWSLPLSVQRVLLDSDAISTALTQVKGLMTDTALGFGQARLILNSADSGYFTPRYLSPLTDNYDNMVNIVRARHGSKVWLQASCDTNNDTNTGKKGAKSVYSDETLYLIRHSDTHNVTNGKTKTVSMQHRKSIFELPHTEQIEIDSTTTRGRALKIQITRWDNMMIRTKKGHSMKDKPFNLFAASVFDAQTGELVFQKPLFIGVFGKQKDQVSTQQAFQEYRNRYDIEVHNRFSAQKLLLNDFQTPNVQTLDNWILIVAAAYWLLFVASKEVDCQVNPWEKYSEKYKNILQNTQKPKQEQPQKSVAQTKKATKSLFATFERKPFAPKSVKNGKGRKIGTRMTLKKDEKPSRKKEKSNFDNETQ